MTDKLLGTFSSFIKNEIEMGREQALKGVPYTGSTFLGLYSYWDNGGDNPPYKNK